ncbi:MAG: ATP-binding cassette domain-containing protein [Thermoguttaceae bacterium]
MIVLSVQDVRKHYGPEPVLDGITFEVHPGERIGLVGPNGVGKTTLMKDGARPDWGFHVFILDLIRAIAGKKPERVACPDEGFADNRQLRANAVQIFQTKGVTSFKTV